MIVLTDNNSPIDVYYDMDIATICQHFNKSRNTVDKAVAKLVRHYPDKGWKYKNPETKRITIKAEGVEKLSTYFRKEKHEVSAVETELRMEIEKLNALLEERNTQIANLEVLYAEKLKLELEKNTQTFLLEQKSKEEEIAQKDSKISEQSEKISEQSDKISEQSDQISEQSEQISTLESENQKLKEQQDLTDQMKNELEAKLEDYRKQEEEYNNKGFFYRLTHKFTLS
ncbi:hypothetical protein [Allobaculum stercoricanis]|uniref:hypothetical protein n=1 Tax=Allobaculum stercoricanis TaxID=174709 RepID=UPI00294313CD|nr:hypothetical protein [Allobaculum stercoricanis]